jgi:hypothetical protein
MGRAMELIAAQVTAPSTGGTPTAVTGDTLTIRPAPQGCLMLNWWYKWQTTAGKIQIISSKLHDRTYGLNDSTILQGVYPVLPLGVGQPLYDQDTLVLSASGSATSGDIESIAMLMYYPELAGINANLIDEMELLRRRVNYAPVEVDITAGTAGGWSGTAAINATHDTFHPNTEYALLGCSVAGALSVGTLCVGVRGSDTGNLRVGMPVNPTDKQVSRQWFLDLARTFREKMIPVFNSASKASTYVEVVNDENAASPVVTLNFVQLSPK